MRGRDERLQVRARPMAFTLFGRFFHHPFLEYRGRPPRDEPNRASVCNHAPRESDTISARSPGFGVRFAAASGPSSCIASIVAQEIYRGESLLFLRKASRLRQRAQPLFARHPAASRPEPAEDPHSGRRLDEAGLRLHLLPEGVQGPESPAPHTTYLRGKRPRLSRLNPPYLRVPPGSLCGARAPLRVLRNPVSCHTLVYPVHERGHLDSSRGGLEALVAHLGAGSFYCLLDGLRGDDPEDHRQVRL